MSIASLKSELLSCRSSLRCEKNTLKAYQAKADELKELYKEMKDKKSSMKDMKSDMSAFSDKIYTNWQGNIFKTRYEIKLKDELVNDKYTKIINIIDDNLDAINTERTRYQNLILESQGIIGHLESRINSLVTRIENWLN